MEIGEDFALIIESLKTFVWVFSFAVFESNDVHYGLDPTESVRII